MSGRRASHIIIRSSDWTMVCLHCEGSYKVNLPMPVSMFAAAGKEFAKIHRNCKPKEKS